MRQCSKAKVFSLQSRQFSVIASKRSSFLGLSASVSAEPSQAVSERLLDIYIRALSVISLRILPKLAWAKKEECLGPFNWKVKVSLLSVKVSLLSVMVGGYPSSCNYNSISGSLFPFFILKGSSHMIAKVTNDFRLTFYPPNVPTEKKLLFSQ